ncbi:unnamed protein product [Boreogadus saida]
MATVCTDVSILFRKAQPHCKNCPGMELQQHYFHSQYALQHTLASSQSSVLELQDSVTCTLLSSLWATVAGECAVRGQLRAATVEVLHVTKPDKYQLPLHDAASVSPLHFILLRALALSSSPRRCRVSLENSLRSIMSSLARSGIPSLP